ncbi:TcdA/TcdB catalytic glycosyltransferase domain-containing protein [Aeromonas hydrophila]|uniref:TcdA/TcdB catalytic glycosyltransferase domain-containing protein n=1 Tax=Aeromonas hydrophila TaxID=644 RepID=UPI0021E6B421|nr:TcdA/TcdB catalytic glycosyltransferase domain-containing protein [Aeromonas hydrophila]MCV3275092.1 hypothetical protein [Aeromonas hydrophila]
MKLKDIRDSILLMNENLHDAETSISCKKWVTKNVDSLITNDSREELQDGLHFVWIGILNEMVLNNIKVWRVCNPRESITLWVDNRFTLSSFLKDVSKRDECIDSILVKQDQVYSIISSSIQAGMTYDHAFRSVLTSNGIDRSVIDNKLLSHCNIINEVSKYADIIDVSERQFILDSMKVSPLYNQEILLRTNIAAASDILRLCIIFHFGGTYIDCDTLPSFDYLFQSEDLVEFEECLMSSHMELLKSELVLRTHFGFYIGDEIRNKNIKLVEDFIKTNHEHEYENLMSVMQSSNIPLNGRGKHKLYKNQILISTKPQGKGIYFNNIIACNKGAKIIKIILAVIKKRYRLLQHYGFDKTEIALDCFQNEKNLDYELARLAGYRVDGLCCSETNTTVSLTGPLAIIETIIGLYIHLLDLPPGFDIEALSNLMQFSKYGISYDEQYLYTYDHFFSSWMFPVIS